LGRGGYVCSESAGAEGRDRKGVGV
jgi:hypothetical protein